VKRGPFPMLSPGKHIPHGTGAPVHLQRAVLRGMHGYEGAIGLDVAIHGGEQMHSGLTGREPQEFRGQSWRPHEQRPSVGLAPHRDRG